MTFILIAELLVIGLLVYAQNREREKWTEERQLLLDRIQAPERTVFTREEPDDRKHYVSPVDEDERYQGALNGDS